MKINKFLAGTLAFVLIAGLGSPVFAASSFSGIGGGTQQSAESVTPDVNRPQTDEDNVIFDGGLGAFQIPCGSQSPGPTCAADFVLEDDYILTDVHFDALDNLGPDVIPEITYFIYADDEDTPNLPGVLKQTGQGVNVHKEAIPGTEHFRYWFDLDNPLLLDGGTTYWIALGGDLQSQVFDWWNTLNGFGNGVAVSADGGDNWFLSGVEGDLNFVLTGHPPGVVGGEFLPINSAALLIAGMSANLSLIVPIAAGIAGVGAYFIRSRMNKE